jgi:hypothetical protein
MAKKNRDVTHKNLPPGAVFVDEQNTEKPKKSIDVRRRTITFYYFNRV